MTMAEYRALLEWYSANKTYPAKTLKVALLDASAGRAKDGTYLREGSKYYANNLIPKGPQGQYAMFADDERERGELPRVPLRDRSSTGTDVDGANGGVGAVAHVHHGHAVRAELAVPGHRAGRNIAANSAAITAFDTDLKNAVTAGFAQQSAKYSGLDQAGEPAALQRHRAPHPAALARPAGAADADRAVLHGSEQATLLAGAPGRYGPRGADPLDRGRRGGVLEPGHPGLQRRRRAGHEHRREPVPGDDQRAIRATPVVQHDRRHLAADGQRARPPPG